MINAHKIKEKPMLERMFCMHKFTGGIRNVFDNDGKKRHARICVKCGQRIYTD